MANPSAGTARPGAAILQPEEVAHFRETARDMADIRLCDSHEALRHTLAERIADVKLVTAFVVGWWPGLEGGIAWGDEDAIAKHPVYLAAKRLRAWLREPAAPSAAVAPAPTEDQK